MGVPGTAGPGGPCSSRQTSTTFVGCLRDDELERRRLRRHQQREVGHGTGLDVSASTVNTFLSRMSRHPDRNVDRPRRVHGPGTAGTMRGGRSSGVDLGGGRFVVDAMHFCAVEAAFLVPACADRALGALHGWMFEHVGSQNRGVVPTVSVDIEQIDEDCDDGLVGS